MDIVSKMSSLARIPVTIDLKPYLADHRFKDNAVLPAVEAMQILARCVKDRFPNARVHTITKASFNKFLALPFEEGAEKITAIADITQLESGDIEAVLRTRIKLKAGAMTRSLVHASLRFSKEDQTENGDGNTFEDDMEAPFFEVFSEKIYNELVPFGPAFRNIMGCLNVFADCAVGNIRAGQLENEQDGIGLLGSSFPLDAAFHAACVWSQRYQKVVAFPVGFEKRTIYQMTRPGETYTAHVRPVKIDGGNLYFDLWITDHEGRLYENVEGLVMKDVSGGKITPPDWIIE